MNLSFKHYYWRWTKNLFFIFFACLILQSLARLGFSFFFGDLYGLIHDPAFKKALLLGVRFDLVPLCYISVLPFLIIQIAYFLPSKFVIKGVRCSIITILFLGYVALGWLYICDYGFYSYFQDHINILFFGLFEDDTQALLISIWKNYNLFFWLVLIFSFHYVLYRVLKFLFSPFDFDLKSKVGALKAVGVLFLGCVFLAWGGRGSFSRLPISIEDAHISSNDFINKVSLNGVLTLNRALKIRREFGNGHVNYLRANGYGDDWRSAFTDAFGEVPKSNLTKSLYAKTPNNELIEQNPPHVVVVVMESFGSYWNDHDSENFQILGELGKHFTEDIVFKNFLSAENGTIGSIVSIATGQVIRPGARFLSESEFMTTPLSSAVHRPYQKAGYETNFVYGGKLGWRDLGKYLQTQKYDFLWGADEIKEAMPEFNNIGEKDLGNEWGIFDEYLYTFIEEHLRTATKPQFFLVLTTSNHPPFEYPRSYQPLKLDLSIELLRNLTVDKDMAKKRFLGVQYANQKIGQFISHIKSSSQKDGVVVALTGDHSYWIAKGVGLEQEFKRFAVPFYVYLPLALKPKNIDTEKFGSHEDIFPTLYHVTLSNAKYVKLGENMFVDDSHATNSSGIVANKSGAFHHGEFWLWKDLNNQVLEKASETAELSGLKKHLLALIGLTDLYLQEERINKKPDVKNGRPE